MHTGGNGLVHPVARAAFFAAFEFDALQGEALADQSVQVDAFGQHIAAEPRGVEVGAVELFSNTLIDRPVEKGDLPFVVFLMVEVAIADQAGSCHAIDGIDFFNTMFEAPHAVAADEVVASGDVDGFDVHIRDARCGIRLMVMVLFQIFRVGAAAEVAFDPGFAAVSVNLLLPNREAVFDVVDDVAAGEEGVAPVVGGYADPDGDFADR